jgi:hypothetical protein
VSISFAAARVTSVPAAKQRWSSERLEFDCRRRHTGWPRGPTGFDDAEGTNRVDTKAKCLLVVWCS